MKMGEALRCPECTGSVVYQKENSGGNGKGSEKEGYLSCVECAKQFRLMNSVGDFLSEREGKRKWGQALMEFEPIVRIYEGEHWRNSRLFYLFTKITLDQEMSLVESINEVGPRDSVLDLACGPGLYTRRFALNGPNRHVIGLDISWPMLKYASTKAKNLGLTNIGFLHGDAHRLPFRDSAFDVVNCTGALHLFPDVPRVLGEVHRVIKPGGRLSIGAFLRNGSQLHTLLTRWEERILGVHPFLQEELERLLDEAGFDPRIIHARGVWMIARGVRRKG